MNSKADEATESKTDIDTQPDGTVVQIQDGSEASEQASGSNNVGSSSQISSSKEEATDSAPESSSSKQESKSDYYNEIV